MQLTKANRILLKKINDNRIEEKKLFFLHKVVGFFLRFSVSVDDKETFGIKDKRLYAQK
jgi:hypothetical protein